MIPLGLETDEWAAMFQFGPYTTRANRTPITKPRSAKYPCRLENVFHSPQELQNVQKFCPDISDEWPRANTWATWSRRKYDLQSCLIRFCIPVHLPLRLLQSSLPHYSFKNDFLEVVEKAYFQWMRGARVNKMFLTLVWISKCGDGKINESILKATRRKTQHERIKIKSKTTGKYGKTIKAAILGRNLS